VRRLVIAALLAAPFAGCDGDGEADAGPFDAGPFDAGPDAGFDAGGVCGELTPQFCPRMWPMDPIPVESLCDAFIEPFCVANQDCCEGSEGRYPSIDRCRSEQLARCQDMMLTYEYPSLVRGGTLRYSQAASGQEFQRAGMAINDCGDVDIAQVILDLYEVPPMRGEFGDTCTESVECRSPLLCREVAGTLACRPNNRGDACEENEDCVGDELRCGSGGTCEDRLPLDAGCAEDGDCVSGFCSDGTCDELNATNRYCVRNIGETGVPAFVP